ncbi:alpha/beta hydrolase [Leptolyngbya sp. FACHB-321]|uniref:alpha/beta hydrolase n=1 Tax=Leptolyngbya sp. FACHB-321 TaxID=2692807 RepID=UPI00168A2CA2|nr:alpha/beta hydrolase [Leptolyngbya sp. FACHB-321]MBD2037152.1 alpha/beta hydrolase [Leptolyngbya sp. FACHB-321]
MVSQLNSPAVKILEVADDPRLSRGTKEFLKVLNSGGVGLETLSPLEARQVLVDGQASVKVDLSGIEESEKTITADGYTITLNIVRPEGVKGILPVFVFIHGGGWVLGDYPTHKRMVRDLVVLSGFAAVFVNYTRTPDAQYPQAINEIYAATKWVAEHGEEIGVDGKNLAIVGNSVGGNMSTVTTLKAKEKGGPHIKLQILFWPIVDADFETDSYHQFGDKRFLTVPTMKWMYDMYIADPEKRKDIYASPLRATIEQLKGLPPALVVVAESDILHDEGVAYGRKLDEAGVDVTLVQYNGMIHDFGLLNGLAELPAVRSLFVQAAAELKKYLQ